MNFFPQQYQQNEQIQQILNPMMPQMGMQQTAQEIYQQYVNEVKQQYLNTPKEPKKKLPKCDLHSTKYSLNCRQCKKIKQELENEQYILNGLIQSNEQDQQIQEIKANDPNQSNKGNSIFLIWGDATTCNLNPLLRNNILNSQYFKDLYALKTYHEVIDEICKKATHVEPWTVGASGVASVSFCCLYKFMLMRLTQKQVKGLLSYQGCPYVRCIGILYIRFVCDPNFLWDWLSKYILDDEEVRPNSDPNYITTIGEYIDQILSDANYYQTRLPRIPVKIERSIKANLLLMNDKRDLKKQNQQQLHKFVKGAKVWALTSQDDQWHEAEVERIEGKQILITYLFGCTQKHEQDDENALEKINQLEQKFQGKKVFLGGEEVLNLEDLKLMNQQEVDEIERKLSKMRKAYERERKDKNDRNNGKSQKRSKDRSRSRSHHKSQKKHSKKHSKKHHKRSRSHKRSRQSSSSSSSRKESKRRLDTAKNYLEKVQRMQQNEALAHSRMDYSKRPTSYKTSLSIALPQSKSKRISRSPSPYKKEVKIEMESTYKPEKEKKHKDEDNQKKQPSKEYLEKMQKLKEIYGDVAADKGAKPKIETVLKTQMHTDQPETFKLG